MPQPLSRVNPTASTIIGNAGDYPLEQRPQLLVLAMRVICAWSTLEGFISGTLVAMLGASAAPAIAMFESLTSTSAQKAALRAAASSVLSARDLELFLALLSEFSSAASHRNKVAHWLWGYSPQVPDGVLLADPAMFVSFNPTSRIRSRF